MSRAISRRTSSDEFVESINRWNDVKVVNVTIEDELRGISVMEQQKVLS